MAIKLMLQSTHEVMVIHKLNKYNIYSNRSGRDLRGKNSTIGNCFLIIVGMWWSQFLSSSFFSYFKFLNHLWFYSFFLFYHLFTGISQKGTINQRKQISTFKLMSLNISILNGEGKKLTNHKWYSTSFFFQLYRIVCIV